MAEEFQSGICSQNWWEVSSRSVLRGGSSCSATLCDVWPTDVNLDLKDSQKPLNRQAADYSSTLKMMDLGHSSSAQEEWNESMLAAESTYNSVLQDDLNSKLNYQQNSRMDSPQIKDSTESSGSCTEACNGFPVGTCSSTLLQSLITADYQIQESLLNNQYSSMSYQSTANYATNSGELLSNSCPKLSSFMKSSLPNMQPAGTHLSENKPYWNTSAVARASFLPSSQSQFLASNYIEKPRCPGFTPKTNSRIQDVNKNGDHEPSPAFKRPRIETPSPLPTFKVRKEKLGDRITALQQLVSPFGKTDTASVLHEATEYIKLLHDQVNILSTPYMKGGTTNIFQQQGAEEVNYKEEPKQDLKNRGLCLVPISSTFPVANETMADLLTPIYGGSFR